MQFQLSRRSAAATFRAMDAYLGNLERLLTTLTKQDFGSSGFWGALAAALALLYVLAGSIARFIFGVNKGLTAPFAAQCLVAVAGLLSGAAALTWILPAWPVAVAVAVVVAALSVRALVGLLGGKYGPALGITIFSLTLFIAFAGSACGLSKSLGEKAGMLKPETDPQFRKAK